MWLMGMKLNGGVCAYVCVARWANVPESKQKPSRARFCLDYHSAPDGIFVGSRHPCLTAIHTFVQPFECVPTGSACLSPCAGLNNFLAWGKANMPGKPVWVTEWGWDARLPGEQCNGTHCVSQYAQAAYAVRGLLILARKGVEQTHW